MIKKREMLASEYITEALFELMTEKEYSEITVTDIAKKAKVSRISFYRSFETKEDIIRKRLHTITDSFIAESGISFKNDSLQDYIITLFEHLLKEREIGTTLQNAGMLYMVNDEFERIFAQNYSNNYSVYKIRFVSGGLFNIYRYWLVNGCRETPDELAVILEDMLVK